MWRFEHEILSVVAYVWLVKHPSMIHFDSFSWTQIL